MGQELADLWPEKGKRPFMHGRAGQHLTICIYIYIHLLPIDLIAGEHLSQTSAIGRRSPAPFRR